MDRRSRVRRGGAKPRGPEVVGPREGRRSPPSMEFGGYAPRKKIEVEIAYIPAFLQAEMVFSAIAARQD